MFKGIVKQKREIVFAIITLVISLVLILISVWSLQYLIVRLNDSISEPTINKSNFVKFDLNKFKQINFGNKTN